jgi:hypothetical protein
VPHDGYLLQGEGLTDSYHILRVALQRGVLLGVIGGKVSPACADLVEEDKAMARR